MKVSLVICSYNRMHTLPRTLEAVSYLRYPDLEVIVVDGPSTDGTEDYVRREWGDRVRLLKCPVANLSVSRNIGIAAAAGDIVVFTDDDGMPEPDWLNRLVVAYEDPRVGAAGGWVRDHTGVSYQTKFIVSRRDSTSDVLLESAAETPPSVPGAFEFPGLIGVNSSFRRSVLLEIGGFDELYAYFLDETDVLARLVDAGYHVKVIPDAQVHHKYAASHIRSEKGLPKTWYQIAKSTAYYCIRNAPPSEPLYAVLRLIEQHRARITADTHWAASQDGWSDSLVSEMLGTLESGIADGIKAAFAEPWRQLLKPCCSKDEWLTLPRTLSAGGRRRVALVTELYPPRPCGGVAVFMHQLAEKLAELGHEVTVITFGEPGRSHTVDFESGVWVHRLPQQVGGALHVDVPHMPLSVNLSAQAVLDELERVDNNRNFEWVLGALWDLPVAGVLAASRFKVAIYLVTSYGLMLDSKPEWRENKQFYQDHVLAMIETEKWALSQADLVLSSTRAIQRDCESIYALDLSGAAVLPFGLREGLVKVEEINGDESIELLFVGRFEQRKGIDLLLEVLPELMTRYPTLTVTLAGDNTLGGETGFWTSFANDYEAEPWFKRINVPGVVSDEMLDTLYGRCDLFVAPSRYESFGLIYLEAMRYAKPCVGFAAGGVPEVVEQGVTGILSQDVTAEGLKSALVKLLDDADLRYQMGSAGRKRFETVYTLDRFAAGFIQQLEQADLTLDM